MCGSIASGRFTYVYHSPLTTCNFCTVDINLVNPQKPVVDCQMVTAPLGDTVQFASKPAFAGALMLEPALALPPLPPPTSDFNPALYGSGTAALPPPTDTIEVHHEEPPAHILDMLR